MATNVNNAERLRSYFLSHKQRENIINVCRARPNWDGCDYCDLPEFKQTMQQCRIHC